MASIHDYAIQYRLFGGKELPVQTRYDLPCSTVDGVSAARDGYL